MFSFYYYSICFINHICCVIINNIITLLFSFPLNIFIYFYVVLVNIRKSLFAFVRAQIVWSEKRSEVKTFAKKIRWRGAAEITRYSGYTCDPRTPQRSFFCGVMQVGEGAQSSTFEEHNSMSRVDWLESSQSI